MSNDENNSSPFPLHFSEGATKYTLLLKDGEIKLEGGGITDKALSVNYKPYTKEVQPQSKLTEPKKKTVPSVIRESLPASTILTILFFLTIIPAIIGAIYVVVKAKNINKKYEKDLAGYRGMLEAERQQFEQSQKAKEEMHYDAIKLAARREARGLIAEAGKEKKPEERAAGAAGTSPDGAANNELQVINKILEHLQTNNQERLNTKNAHLLALYREEQKLGREYEDTAKRQIEEKITLSNAELEGLSKNTQRLNEIKDSVNARNGSVLCSAINGIDRVDNITPSLKQSLITMLSNVYMRKVSAEVRTGGATRP